MLQGGNSTLSRSSIQWLHPGGNGIAAGVCIDDTVTITAKPIRQQQPSTHRNGILNDLRGDVDRPLMASLARQPSAKVDPKVNIRSMVANARFAACFNRCGDMREMRANALSALPRAAGSLR